MVETADVTTEVENRCQRFLWTECRSRHPANSVKALKVVRSTDSSQWPGRIHHYRTLDGRGVDLICDNSPTPVLRAWMMCVVLWRKAVSVSVEERRLQ